MNPILFLLFMEKKILPEDVIGIIVYNSGIVLISKIILSELTFFKEMKPFLNTQTFSTVFSTLNLALEIGKEGREGRPVGTAFVIGDCKNVLKYAKQLVINPFANNKKTINVLNKENWEHIKAFTALDGVFIIKENGRVLSAGTFLTVESSKALIPVGLGARHAAVASITKMTDAIGIVVSKSGGKVRVFKSGKMIAVLDPWKIP